MRPGKILAIDVGNSRIKFGLFAGNGVDEQSGLAEPISVVAVRHGDPIPWEMIGVWRGTSHDDADQSLLAGVKPAALERLLADWPNGDWPLPRVIAEARDLPLTVRVDAPNGVGIDRLLGAVAVNALRARNQPAIVVGSGTATTVDVIAADGAFEGGAILPGFELGARSLQQHTALLPLVTVEELSPPNLPAIGRNTPAAIRSGLLYGQVGAVKEIVARLSEWLTAGGGSGVQASSGIPLVFVTGGNGSLLAPYLGSGVRFERELPLRGLARLAGRTRH